MNWHGEADISTLSVWPGSQSLQWLGHLVPCQPSAKYCKNTTIFSHCSWFLQNWYSSGEAIYRQNASELDATNNHFEQSSRVGFIFLFVGVGASIASSLASHESLVANNLYRFKYKETRRKVMTGLGECWKQNMQRIIPEGQVQVWYLNPSMETTPPLFSNS